jgi:hypothetical protein
MIKTAKIKDLSNFWRIFCRQGNVILFVSYGYKVAAYIMMTAKSLKSSSKLPALESLCR